MINIVSACLNPMQASQAEFAGTLALPSGGEVPDFRVEALDTWENPTAPCSEMPFCLNLESSALDPTRSSFDFSPSALVTGKSTENRSSCII